MDSTLKLILAGAATGITLAIAWPNALVVAAFISLVLVVVSMVLVLPFVPTVRRVMQQLPTTARDTAGMLKAGSGKNLWVRIATVVVALIFSIDAFLVGLLLIAAFVLAAIRRLL